MEDNRKEVDPSGQEHIEGEQNGQTVQTLADDQNVKPSADEIKKAKKREADKRCRDRKKQKLNKILRQLRKQRAGRAKLKKKCAFLKGKLKQSQEDKAQLIKAYKRLRQTVKEQNKITKQQNTATEQQSNMIYKLMQQLMPGTTGFETGEAGLSDVRHPTINLSRGTTESGGPGGPGGQESLPLSHQVERAHWNTIEQPPLSYGGLTHGGDMSGSHGLYYTSPPRAAMASGSSPMQGPLATGGQLPFGGTGLPVHHPLGYQSGTIMGSGGLANENSPGLPQSHVSQGLTHPPWEMTPDNTFDTWEAGPPVHHPPPEGPAIEYPLELSQSHPPQGWPHENNFEQPDSTYGDQFIEVSGCSNNIDGCYN